MSLDKIKDIITDSFKITINNIDKDIELKFSGVLDIEDPYNIIDPFLNNIHNEIINNNIKNIIVNIIELYFINSSTIKSIIKWLVKLPKLSESQKYKATFFINKDLFWQLQSFDSFKYFGKGLVEIQSK